MQEVESNGQRRRTAGRSGRGRNGYETVAGAVSEAFTGWLHHRYMPIELPLIVSGAYRFAVRYLV